MFCRSVVALCCLVFGAGLCGRAGAEDALTLQIHGKEVVTPNHSGILLYCSIRHPDPPNGAMRRSSCSFLSWRRLDLTDEDLLAEHPRDEGGEAAGGNDINGDAETLDNRVDEGAQPYSESANATMHMFSQLKDIGSSGDILRADNQIKGRYSCSVSCGLRTFTIVCPVVHLEHSNRSFICAEETFYVSLEQESGADLNTNDSPQNLTITDNTSRINNETSPRQANTKQSNAASKNGDDSDDDKDAGDDDDEVDNNDDVNDSNDDVNDSNDDVNDSNDDVKGKDDDRRLKLVDLNPGAGAVTDSDDVTYVRPPRTRRIMLGVVALLTCVSCVSCVSFYRWFARYRKRAKRMVTTDHPPYSAFGGRRAAGSRRHPHARGLRHQHQQRRLLIHQRLQPQEYERRYGQREVQQREWHRGTAMPQREIRQYQHHLRQQQQQQQQQQQRRQRYHQQLQQRPRPEEEEGLHEQQREEIESFVSVSSSVLNHPFPVASSPRGFGRLFRSRGRQREGRAPRVLFRSETGSSSRTFTTDGPRSSATTTTTTTSRPEQQRCNTPLRSADTREGSNSDSDEAGGWSQQSEESLSMFTPDVGVEREGAIVFQHRTIKLPSYEDVVAETRRRALQMTREDSGGRCFTAIEMEELSAERNRAGQESLLVQGGVGGRGGNEERRDGEEENHLRLSSPSLSESLYNSARTHRQPYFSPISQRTPFPPPSPPLLPPPPYQSPGSSPRLANAIDYDYLLHVPTVFETNLSRPPSYRSLPGDTAEN